MVKKLPQNSYKILILGCGGHAKVITEVAKSQGFCDFHYQDLNYKNEKFLGSNILNNEINNYSDYFFVAIGDNFTREKITLEFQLKNPNAIAATLVHPSSYISENCSIGNGSVVMPLSVINSFTKIGKGVIVNTRSSLDHDNNITDFASIAPGVTTGGNVKIGERTAISIGATIKNNIEIGSDSIIGACSYLNKDIGDNIIAYGNPAKFVRKRETGEKYL